MSRDDVVVVGGGAVGVCCAYELARSGRQVRLLERADLCAGSSYGNAGFVPPSRSVPLSGPGVIAKSLGWLRDPHGPFRLRPRPDPELARWLWRFRSLCNADAARRSTIILRDLTRASQALYEELAARDDLDFGYRRNGLLTLARSEVGRAALLAESELLAGLGIESRALEPDGVRALEPRAGAAVTGGVLYHEDAHLEPGRFVRGLARLAEAEGAVIETGSEVRRLRIEGGRIVGVDTSRGQLEPELVVLANGAWAATIGRTLGLRLLIEPAKGYSFALRREPDVFETPLLLAEARTTVTPMGGVARVTGKLDLVGFDDSIRGERVHGIPLTLRDYLDVPDTAELLESWCGFRPLTPDGLPLLGRHRAAGNLILAVGHGRLGVALGPITGRVVAALAVGEPPPIDLEPLRPDRFERAR